MKIKRVVPNIKSDRIEESWDFYEGFLGFQTAQVSVMRGDESAALHPQVSIEVDDVDQAHAVAIERNLRIVYPLSDEPWGVRRFFVADPNGVVINILSHTTPQKRSNKRMQLAKARQNTAKKRSSRRRLRT
jgi:hypothetical protein